MIVTTTIGVDGQVIKEHKGIVRGITFRLPTIRQGISGMFQGIVGGQVAAYTEMCEQARQEAYNLMVQHALDRHANAIVGMRYDASESNGGTEVLCYGTAVIIEPIK